MIGLLHRKDEGNDMEQSRKTFKPTDGRIIIHFVRTSMIPAVSNKR